MYKVSGPVAVFVLKVKDTSILLFGDWHESKEHQCTPCTEDCLYITDLLQRMKPKTDLFIESYINYYPSFMKRHGMTNDVLGDVIKTNFSKMHNHQGKTTNNIRIHYSDIRTLLNYSAFHDTFLYFLNKINFKYTDEYIGHLNKLSQISWCDTQEKLKTFIDIMLLSNDYLVDVSKLIPKGKLKPFVQRRDLLLYQRKYVSRLRRQFMVLNSEHQKHVLSYHDEVCTLMMKQHYKFDTVMLNVKKNKNLTLEEEQILADALFYWNFHVKDLYTIARMLQYLERTNNIISYDGVLHSKRYAYFFSKYMKAKGIHQVNNIQKSQSSWFKLFTKQQLRCVKLPKSIATEVFQML